MADSPRNPKTNEITEMRDRLSSTRIDELLEKKIPRSDLPHVTIARHIIAGLACLVTCSPSNALIPVNIRKSASEREGFDSVMVAIDWFGHSTQFAQSTAKKHSKDLVVTTLESVYDELADKFAKKTVGQRGMRHVSCVLVYCDDTTRKAAIAYLVSLTDSEKDKLNETRLERIDDQLAEYLDMLQKAAEEARQQEDFYDGVDESTPAVHVPAGGNVAPDYMAKATAGAWS